MKSSYLMQIPYLSAQNNDSYNVSWSLTNIQMNAMFWTVTSADKNEVILIFH